MRERTVSAVIPRFLSCVIDRHGAFTEVMQGRCTAKETMVCVETYKEHISHKNNETKTPNFKL